MSSASTRRRGAAVLVVTAALGGVLVGCSRGDDTVQVRATGAPASSSATASAQTSSPATATTATTATTASSGPLASSAGTARAPSPASSTAPPSTPTSTGSASTSVGPASSAPAGSWPKALGEPTQGQPAWGVYLAVGHSATDPAVEKAVRQAAGVGYDAVVGDIACDGGALDALQLDQFDYWTGATLYFPTQADARGFVASYTARVAKPKGVVKVKVGCLD